MNNYFELPIEARRKVLQQVSNKYGLPPQAIEKDLWVSTILQIVFKLPFADKLIFKGGTSLSKVWHLIDRFSEDIDLSIDRSLFDFDGDLSKRQLKKLRKASSVFVRNEFLPGLVNAISEVGLDTLCTIESEQDGEGDNTYPEPRKIFISYESSWDQDLDYLKPIVMLEIGARSLHEPNREAEIKSMVEEAFPTITTSIVKSHITTAVAAKTFLEKAFLIHEIFSVEGHGSNANRKSRHLYDLSRMMDEDFANAAIADDYLWESIRHHREIYTAISGVDYTPDIRRRIVLVPPQNIIAVWAADYNNMASSMIFGIKPTFSQLIDLMGVLQEKFRNQV